MSFLPGENIQALRRDPQTGKWLDAQTGQEAYSPPASDGHVFMRGNHGQVFRYADIGAAIFTNHDVMRYTGEYPGPINVHVEQALSDFAVGYEVDSGMFIGPEISPVSTQTHRTNEFFVLNREDVTRDYGTLLKRGIGAVANDIQQGFSLSQYACIDYAVRDFLPDKVVDNADEALQLTQQTTLFLTSVMEFGWDRRVLAAINGLTQTNTFAGLTVSGATLETATPSDPYITQAITKALGNAQLLNNGYTPNTLLVNAATARAIMASPEMVQRTIYQPGGGTVIRDGGLTNAATKLAGMPSEFMGLNVVVENIPTNEQPKGLTPSYTPLFANAIALLYVDQPSRRTRNCVTTFRVGGINVRTYRDESRRGTFIEVEMDQDEQVTNPYGGYLITAVS